MDSWFDNVAPYIGIVLFILALLYNVGFRYRLTDRNIEVRFFQILPFRTIPYDEVEGLERTTTKLIVGPFTARYNSRLMGPSVTIYLKGLRRPVEVTPDYPYEFVSDVSKYVYEQTGRWPWVR